MSKQKDFIAVLVIVAVVGFGIYWVQSSKTQPDVIKKADTADIIIEDTKVMSYTDIESDELATMLKEKDFELVDVHIPEQVHIPGTDSMIAYNDLDALKTAFPDKNAKIVLYCRSGGMSAATAEVLVAEGYTNVYNLVGGMNKWKAEGRETLPKGSIQ